MQNNTKANENKIVIDEAISESKKAYKAVVNQAFGTSTVLISMPADEFLMRSIVPNEHGVAQGIGLGDVPSQRPINMQHALGLAIYMLKGELHALRKILAKTAGGVPVVLDRIVSELGNESYYGVAPIVANIRPQKIVSIEQDSSGITHLMMAIDELFRVIDGQHRREGRSMLIEWLKTVVTTGKYPTGRKTGPMLYLPADSHVELTADELQIWGMVYRAALRAGFEISVHLNLDSEQERQLFFVLNNLTRQVDASLAFDFDESNPVNQFIKNTLMDHLKIVVVTKDQVDRDEGEMALKDLIAINAILFLNKTNVRSATPMAVQSAHPVATKFWEAITAVPGFGKKGAKSATVAVQPVVLKALARLVYDFAFQQKDAAATSKLLESIPKLDLSHDNPMWQYYSMDPAVRETKCPGLMNYLPPAGTGNRDVGSYDPDTKRMNFGAKHNDIYPLLGDMVRWTLQMPPRQHRQKEVSKTAAPPVSDAA